MINELDPLGGGNSRRIENEWMTYRKFLSPQAGAVQVKETRRAFYAGAQAFYSLLMSQLQPGEDATEADLALLDDLSLELTSFAQSVLRGES